jgi:hypothetical protein
MIKVPTRKSIIALICIVLCIFVAIFYLLNSNHQKDAGQSAKVRALNRSIRTESDREVRTAKKLESKPPESDYSERKVWRIWVSTDHSKLNTSRSFKSKVFLVDQLIKSDHKIKYHVIFPFRGWVQGVPSSRSPPLIPLMIHQPILNTINELPSSPCRNLSNFRKDTDYKGGDLEGIQNPVQVSSPQECCEACSGTNGCGHWTYTPEGSCWLKNPTTLTESNNPGLISGVAYANIPHRRNIPPMMSQGAPRSETRPELPCCDFEEDSQLHAYSQYSIHEFKKTVLSKRQSTHSGMAIKSDIVAGNWDEQLLIGNGKIGAMVGGTAEYEVIPLSISNFFGYNKLSQGGNPVLGENGAPNIRKANSLEEARKCLQDREHKCAGKYLQKFQKENLGMFEYIADIGMIFSPVALKEKPNKENQDSATVGKNNVRFQGPPPQIGPNGRRANRMPFSEGRRGIVEALRMNFDQPSEIQSNMGNVPRSIPT